MRSVNRLIEQFTDRKFDLRSVNHLIEQFTDRKSLAFTDFLELRTAYQLTMTSSTLNSGV